MRECKWNYTRFGLGLTVIRTAILVVRVSTTVLPSPSFRQNLAFSGLRLHCFFPHESPSRTLRLYSLLLRLQAEHAHFPKYSYPMDWQSVELGGKRPNIKNPLRTIVRKFSTDHTRKVPISQLFLISRFENLQYRLLPLMLIFQCWGTRSLCLKDQQASNHKGMEVGKAAE